MAGIVPATIITSGTVLFLCFIWMVGLVTVGHSEVPASTTIRFSLYFRGWSGSEQQTLIFPFLAF